MGGHVGYRVKKMIVGKRAKEWTRIVLGAPRPSHPRFSPHWLGGNARDLTSHRVLSGAVGRRCCARTLRASLAGRQLHA